MDTPASPKTPAPHSRTANVTVASPAASSPGVRALVAELMEATNRINDLYSTMVEATPTTGGDSPVASLASGRSRDPGADGGCAHRFVFLSRRSRGRDVLEIGEDLVCSREGWIDAMSGSGRL
jgi:hypothetical protein